MGESTKHVELIKLMEELIIFNEKINPALLLLDEPSNRKNSPPTINGFKPDIYYDFDGVLVIGEAKTKDDIVNEHTRRQLETYIKLCSNFKGRSCLYIAVPWTESILVNNIVKNIMKKLKTFITYHVVDELKKL